jgi:hypothetical protein
MPRDDDSNVIWPEYLTSYAQFRNRKRIMRGLTGHILVAAADMPFARALEVEAVRIA